MGKRFLQNCIAECQNWTNHQWYVSNSCNLRVIVVLFSYVVSYCSCVINIFTPQLPSKRPSLFHQSSILSDFSKNDLCLPFFELVSVESCFIDNLPYFSIRRIKQMTPVLFPYPVLSPHTAYLMLPSKVAQICRHFRD